MSKVQFFVFKMSHGKAYDIVRLVGEENIAFHFGARGDCVGAVLYQHAEYLNKFLQPEDEVIVIEPNNVKWFLLAMDVNYENCLGNISFFNKSDTQT